MCALEIFPRVIIFTLYAICECLHFEIIIFLRTTLACPINMYRGARAALDKTLGLKIIIPSTRGNVRRRSISQDEFTKKKELMLCVENIAITVVEKMKILSLKDWLCLGVLFAVCCVGIERSSMSIRRQMLLLRHILPLLPLPCCCVASSEICDEEWAEVLMKLQIISIMIFIQFFIESCRLNDWWERRRKHSMFSMRRTSDQITIIDIQIFDISMQRRVGVCDWDFIKISYLKHVHVHEAHLSGAAMILI